MNFLSAITIVVLALPALGRGMRPDSAKTAAMQACSAKYAEAQHEFADFASSGSTTSSDFKCYLSCILQARGIMTPEGVLTMPNNPMKPIAVERQPCFSLPPASNACESAYQHLKCVWEKNPSRDFLRAFMPRVVNTTTAAP